jgi:FKBP-type peptidyl-prolyl cis-trans isomerase 2
VNASIIRYRKFQIKATSRNKNACQQRCGDYNQGDIFAIRSVKEKTMGDAAKVIEWGSTITVEMELKLDDGELVSSTKEDGLLSFTVGKGEVVPGLEEKLIGMKVGEAFSITLEPEEGYGDYDEDDFELVDRSVFAEEIEVGEDYYFEDEEGNLMIVTVAEIRDDGVVVDYNHPLAGEILYFNGKVVSID